MTSSGSGLWFAVGFGAGVIAGGLFMYAVLKPTQVGGKQVSVSQPKPAVQGNTTYKNNEKWIIERAKDGTIQSLTVTRDARVNACS